VLARRLGGRLEPAIKFSVTFHKKSFEEGVRDGGLPDMKAKMIPWPALTAAVDFNGSRVIGFSSVRAPRVVEDFFRV